MSLSSAYKINWLDLSNVGYPDSVGLGFLLGYKHRFIARSLDQDLGVLKSNGVTHIILLCESTELRRFGVSVSSLHEFEIHHYACEYGQFPDMETLLEIINTIFGIIGAGEKCIIVSRDGLGRSCVVGGALILHTNEELSYSDVYAMMKRLVGRRAIQTVKQYNFLIDFRQLRDNHIAKTDACNNQRHDRHLSR